MDAQRLFKTVMFDLNSKQAKLEDDLERIINSNEPLSEKSDKAVKLLMDLGAIELAIAKFSNMIAPPNQENNTQQNNTTNE